MGRPKATVRRGRIPAPYFRYSREGHEEGERSKIDRAGSHFFSSLTSSMLQIDGISDVFIDFLYSRDFGASSSNHHPKRQRLSPVIAEYDNIVVRRTKLMIRFPEVQTKHFEKPIERHDVPILVDITEPEKGVYRTEIYDTTDKFRRLILDVTLPAQGGVPLLDVQIASRVVTEAGSWQNPHGNGRLWAETDVRLDRDELSGYLEIIFIIKWNTTPSLDSMYRRRVNRPALQAVLDAYFPEDSHGEDENSWSAQNFYSSVYTPDKSDDEASSITTDQLDTDLYPFQKRSIRWLLEREGVRWSKADRRIVPLVYKAHDLPYSFHEVKDVDGRTCYVSHFLKVVAVDLEPYRQIETLRGGILAEEMGLGKTVEIIALICLHNCSINTLEVSAVSSAEISPSSATLIITPPSILSQWITELQRHSPRLKVFNYKGIKSHPELEGAQLLGKLSTCDVVFTTYNVLSSEIHYSLPAPDRQLRAEKRYIPPKSPLTQLLWWRVCLDEAQMIESGVSNAATVAKLIPRIFSWAVTGTPVQRDLADLLGLLVFLRLEPFMSMPHFWSSLVSQHRSSFHAIFKKLALRHTKQSVSDELQLPLQKRFVVTMPFTPIEEQHYQSLFQQMCEDCSVDARGTPIIEDWDPEEPGVIEQMRTWLVRLRQTALHPEVGSRNKRALGRKQGPLRTVNDVLAAMLEQSEISIRADQRALLISKLKRGQMLENGPEVKRALVIWTDVLQEASGMVSECRQQLRSEIVANSAEREAVSSSKDALAISESDSGSSGEGDSTKMSARIGTLNNRLRDALEVQHIATFFQANGYFQIKSNETFTAPGSEDFKNLDKLETEGYERAKNIRQEILKEILKKVNKLMGKVARNAKLQSFVQIPEFTSNFPRGGFESRRVLEQINELGKALDAQANHLDDWREQTIKLLLRPLVDEDEGIELTGDEYEQSTKTQDEVLVLVQALRTVIEDRHDSLTGQENLLVNSEVKSARKLADEGAGPFPEKLLQILKVREEVKPPKEHGSIRGIVSELRTLSTNLKLEADKGNSRASNELYILEQDRQRIQKQYSEQSKVVTALRQEVDLFTTLMNFRLEYYRQLQQLSDMVKPLEDAEKLRLNNIDAEEEKLTRRVATSNAKRRYLIHLRDETTSDSAQQRMCIICQSNFEIGALTICGHQFCKECMGLWWNAHHNCPVCKRRLTRNDLHDITYKPQELKMSEEIVDVSLQENSSVPSVERSAIYSEIKNSNIFAQIKNIDLDGPSFTTKISTLARHLLWLREQDPGAKSIIFSQFKEFLDVLGRALANFRIGFSSIDKPGGVEQFKQDPSIECFLLHARAHSSGLNLVNASHVFLCEPLINTALELQAIARVHRIGQHQATTVWLYIIDGTVEESIYRISVQRRLEHMAQYGKGKEINLTPEALEHSNSLELQDVPLAKLLTKGRTGGEYVEKKDLWSCLFGKNVTQNRPAGSEMLDREIARHLGAEAAEERCLEGPSAS